jgi:hypothetical protein
LNFELIFHLNNMKDVTFVYFVQKSWWKAITSYFSATNPYKKSDET